MLINRISESSLLIREGQKTLKSLQGEIKKITDQLKRGNMSPGIGNKPIAAGLQNRGPGEVQEFIGELDMG